MVSVLRSLLLTVRSLPRSRAALHLEILALRHQLGVLQRTRLHRVRLARTDRWLWVMLVRVWAGWRTTLVLVKPETVIFFQAVPPGGDVCLLKMILHDWNDDDGVRVLRR